MVSKEFNFDAVQITGSIMMVKCKALHGHTYRLQIAVSDRLMTVVWQLILATSNRFTKKHLEPSLDHHYLNESLPYMNTSQQKIWFTGF